MTGIQKQNIQDMRQKGMIYSQIAEVLNLSVNTVKSFCRRNNLTACDASKDTGIEENKENNELCKQCGKRLERTPKSKPKTFCGDSCRYTWWNANREQSNQKAVHHISCGGCGRVFKSYGNRARKYCGHPCYIKSRFEGGAAYDARAI